MQNIFFGVVLGEAKSKKGKHRNSGRKREIASQRRMSAKTQR